MFFLDLLEGCSKNTYYVYSHGIRVKLTTFATDYTPRTGSRAKKKKTSIAGRPSARYPAAVVAPHGIPRPPSHSTGLRHQSTHALAPSTLRTPAPPSPSATADPAPSPFAVLAHLAA